MISRETLPGWTGGFSTEGRTMALRFSEASLEMLLSTAFPMADMLTGGKVAAAGLSVAGRAAAMQIAAIEFAELMGAVVAATETPGITLDQIKEIVSEAKDIKTAMSLLKDPSAIVVLDGERTTVTGDLTAPVDEDPPAEDLEE